MLGTDFDVVVAGAGSAGCVASAELVRLGARVALVEAGPDYGTFEARGWPTELLAPDSQPRTHDWGFTEERASGARFPESRARVIGGCSAHNECGAVWGLPTDYDAWVDHGCAGWSWSELFPLIDRLERATPALPHRGAHGPLLTQAAWPDPHDGWQGAFLDAARSAGFSELSDIGEPSGREGLAPFYLNITSNVRQNAAFAFVDPVRANPRLTIVDQAQVDRLVIEGDHARAIVVHRAGATIEIEARQFLLCSGSYGSPMILLRSGIGPRAHLVDLGIEPRLDVPGVGANLHDHPGVVVRFQPSAVSASRNPSAHPLVLRAKSHPARQMFDLHLLPYEPVDPQTGERASIILAFLMRPRSRGSLRLRSTEPSAAPEIRFAFLSDEEDLHAVSAALRLVRGLAQRSPLSELIRTELSPGEHPLVDERGVCLDRAISGYGHAVGTCRMGGEHDAAAVVDANGRVRGLQNVAVADASIMPTIPGANTNLSAMLVGMKIAAAILPK